jgi:hypothetical protein
VTRDAWFILWGISDTVLTLTFGVVSVVALVVTLRRR